MLDEARGDEPLVHCTMTDEQMDKQFDDGYGCIEGCHFQAWTATRVFFPVTYDGSEGVGMASRNPCDEALEHQRG